MESEEEEEEDLKGKGKAKKESKDSTRDKRRVGFWLRACCRNALCAQANLC